MALHTAVWDAGYHGKGQSLLTVHNVQGIFLERYVRIGQLVFHRLERPTVEGYAGQYQGENLDE